MLPLQRCTSRYALRVQEHRHISTLVKFRHADPPLAAHFSSTSSHSLASFNPFKKNAPSASRGEPTTSTTANSEAAETAVDENVNSSNDGKTAGEEHKLEKISWKLPEYDEDDAYGDKSRQRGKFEQWMNKFKPLKMFNDSVKREKEKLRYDLRNAPTREYRLLVAANFKLFTASDNMMPAGNSIDFPSSYKLLKNVQSYGALAREGSGTKNYTDMRAAIKRRRATLLFVSFVADAGNQASTWIDPFEEKYANNKNVASFDLGITEGIAYRTLRSVLDKNLVKQTPPEKHDTKFVWYARNEETYAFKRHLGIENSKTGYVYLCDNKGRVRWTATGQPLDKEMQTLFRLTNELLATS